MVDIVAVIDDVGSTVHFLRGDAIRFKPLRVKQDFDGLWDIEFLTYFEGQL